MWPQVGHMWAVAQICVKHVGHSHVSLGGGMSIGGVGFCEGERNRAWEMEQ